MSHAMSRETMIRQLVALGIDRAKAEARVDQVIGRSTESRKMITLHHEPGRPAAASPAPAPSVLVAPNGTLRLTLPWSALAPDNLRVPPLGAAAKAKRAAYDRAKAAAVDAIRAQTHDAVRLARGLPWSGPIALYGSVFVPDDRIRDVTNFGKLVLDALEEAGVVRNDRWFWDTRWTRPAVDPDAPRIELTLAPFARPDLPEPACG